MPDQALAPLITPGLPEKFSQRIELAKKRKDERNLLLLKHCAIYSFLRAAELFCVTREDVKNMSDEEILHIAKHIERIAWRWRVFYCIPFVGWLSYFSNSGFSDGLVSVPSSCSVEAVKFLRCAKRLRSIVDNINWFPFEEIRDRKNFQSDYFG